MADTNQDNEEARRLQAQKQQDADARGSVYPAFLFKASEMHILLSENNTHGFLVSDNTLESLITLIANNERPVAHAFNKVEAGEREAMRKAAIELVKETVEELRNAGESNPEQVQLKELRTQGNGRISLRGNEIGGALAPIVILPEAQVQEQTQSAVDESGLDPSKLQAPNSGEIVEDAAGQGVNVATFPSRLDRIDLPSAQAEPSKEEEVEVDVSPTVNAGIIERIDIPNASQGLDLQEEPEELAVVTMSELSDGKGAHDSVSISGDENKRGRQFSTQSGSGTETVKFDASKINVDDASQITDITVLHQLVEGHKEYNDGKIVDENIYALSEVLSKIEGRENLHFITSDVSAHIQDAYNKKYAEHNADGIIDREDHNDMIESAAKAAVEAVGSTGEIVTMDRHNQADDVRPTLPNADSIAQTAKNNEREV